MHNVEFLEKQWFKLKLKTLLFKLVIVILIIVTLSITFSFIYLKVDFKELKGLMEFKKEEVKKEVITTPLPTTTPIMEEEPAPIYKDIIEEEKIIDEKIKSKPDTQIISISKTQKDFLTILKEKFIKNPNYTSAISIAEEYYKKDNFKEALKWSIKANELDDKQDSSWLIFAKSKEKLNKLDEAINALKVYLTKNSSTKIEELLNMLLKKEKINRAKIEEKKQKEVVKFEKKESKEDILAKIKIVKKAYYAYPNAKDALTLAKSYVEIENYKNCMFWAEKLIKILPNNEAGYIYYGTCAPKERYFTKSIKILRDYLKKDPNNEKIKSLIEKIKQQKDRG